MELIETTLSPGQRRAGATWVPWTELAAQQRRRGDPTRVLAPGDAVLLQVDGDTVHRGRVLRYVGAGAQGAYVIVFGPARARPAPRRRTEPHVQDVEVHVVPTQRSGHVSLDL